MFTQSTVLSCESVIYIKSFNELFYFESLRILNERMNIFMDAHTFKCCNCLNKTDPGPKSHEISLKNLTQIF